MSTGNPINGYVNGAVSPPTVAWVPALGTSNMAVATISSTTPFAFDSAALTSAWNDKLLLQVTGYLNGQIVGSQNVTLNPSAPTMVNFNFPQVDTVRLSASGGTYDPSFPSPSGIPSSSIPPSPQFVIDNVTIDQPTVIPEPPPVQPPLQSPVPEPSCLAVAGLLIAGWWLHRRRA